MQNTEKQQKQKFPLSTAIPSVAQVMKIWGKNSQAEPEKMEPFALDDF